MGAVEDGRPDSYPDASSDSHRDIEPVRHSDLGSHGDGERQHDADPPCDQRLDGGAGSLGDGHRDAQADHQADCREDSHPDGDAYVRPQGRSSDYVDSDRIRYSGSAAESHADILVRICALSLSGITRWAGSR